MSVSGVTGSTGTGSFGGPGQAKSLVEATLSENAKQQAWNNAPLRIPDARLLFNLGNNLNIIA